MSGNTASTDYLTLASYPRAILHIDCDAFFASCEQARQPRLKSRPIVTGKERGIVSCASYEAKALGVRRGIRLSEAKRICPELLILPSDYETYSIYSKRLFDIMRSFTPIVEEFSIDEAFCDITGLRRLYRSSYPDIARLIKNRIQNELDITVSVGLSISKSLAKICSRYKKPDGFTAIPGREIHTFLKDIALEMVCGFGPNTVALLEKCGVKNVLDYVKRPPDFASKLLGKTGLELWHELRGQKVYEICAETKEKYLSITKSKTFSPASSDKELVKAQLMRNLESAFMKLRRHRLNTRVLTVYLRTAGFRDFGIEARLNRHSSSTLDFVPICAGLFETIFKKGAIYRATGVILSNINDEGVDTMDLFDDPLKIDKIARISETMDAVNKKYGKYAIHIAASGPAIVNSGRETGGEAHPRQDLAWRKKELLKGETFRRRLSIPMLKLDRS